MGVGVGGRTGVHGCCVAARGCVHTSDIGGGVHPTHAVPRRVPVVVCFIRYAPQSRPFQTYNIYSQRRRRGSELRKIGLQHCVSQTSWESSDAERNAHADHIIANGCQAWLCVRRGVVAVDGGEDDEQRMWGMGEGGLVYLLTEHEKHRLPRSLAYISLRHPAFPRRGSQLRTL